MGGEQTHYEPSAVTGTQRKEEPTRAELLKEIIHPDRQEGTNGFLNKELKISNIKRQDLGSIGSVLNLTDIALQCYARGCTKAAAFFIDIRDTFLSATSSVGGFERKMEVSDISIMNIPPEKKKAFDSIYNKNK